MTHNRNYGGTNVPNISGVLFSLGLLGVCFFGFEFC